LSDRVYTCECGNVMDRDLNAAINLLQAKKYTILT
ncbi:zinc ribbon domain-containing protein, partial [Bacillus wiedmannii]